MEQAVNEFTGGLVTDFAPMSTNKKVLTSALNATLVTYNGNEYQLQNDMGNGRVETAYLPEGFVPVGTCSYGGIIYIASYNPLTGMSQIGSFPSPERNFGFEKNAHGLKTSLDKTIYKVGDILRYQNIKIKPLCDIKLSPGDRFVITVPKESIAQMFGYVDGVKKNGLESGEMTCVDLVIGIQQDDKVIELADLKNFTSDYDDNSYSSVFTQTDNIDNDGNVDLDEYRSVLQSPYQIVSGSFAGTLCLIIKLKTIDSFEVGYNVNLLIDE